MGPIRVMHISDVHVGDADPALLRAAVAAARQIGPDCIVASGDLTEAGRRREYAALGQFLSELPAPIVACPGNHDVPVLNLMARLSTPFGRFARLARELGLLERWTSPCGGVRIEAFNSARGVQPRLDWSQGCYGSGFAAAARRLDGPGTADWSAAHQPDGWRLLVCHHPPLTPPGARVASTPRRARAARAWLGEARRLVLLAGHVHGHWSIPLGPSSMLVTAPSLGSRRQRGAGAGFTLLELQPSGGATRQLWRFGAGGFCAAAAPVALQETSLETAPFA
jgi:3',5'-cyclic AMP phosphodiesterase CpdA